MNKSQILALMMRSNHQNTQTDLLSISDLLAQMLSDVCDRLSEDEFYRFISVGSAVYSHGLEQFSETEDVSEFVNENETEDTTLQLRRRH